MMNDAKINNYKNALVEVESILNCLKHEDYCKIPKEIIDAIEINKNEDYIFEYDENLDFKDWELMPETRAILYNLFKKYLATNEQRQYFLEKEKLEMMQLEQEKNKKYNSNIVFKKREKNKESKALIEIKDEKWYTKIFNSIKSFFR